LHSEINQEILLLRQKLDRTNRELEILYEVSNAMRSTLELNTILYAILTGVTAHTGLGFNRAILFLVNKQERCLEPKMAIGPESAEHAGHIWEYLSREKQNLAELIEEGKIIQNANHSSLFQSVKHIKVPLTIDEHNLLARVYHRGEPEHLKADQLASYRHDHIISILGTNEIALMPLKAKDKVNGLIIVDNVFTQKNITPDDIRIFTMLANQAGLAIENANLYELVKHKSHTDAITSLWNHGFFQNKLSEEIQKAREQSTLLSLLIMDLDNFKALNDTFGHQNGDIVLKDVARILNESCRETDYPCRYGGEEFSIILPQINKEQAFGIAERIRQKIEQNVFTDFSLYETVRVTVSIGIASFPHDADNKKDLIAQADRAMYKAKFSGKNQTYTAE
jgi:diguanylate cyclase (GGDEF)-like protein